LTDIVTLWIGDSLGPIERACMRSMLRHRDHVVLYSYSDVAGVPEGVEIRDASPLIPRSSIPDSWAQRSDLYSDWFRYEVQKRGLGTWLDLDMYLLAPLPEQGDYLFGEYEPGKINGAVLRLPPDAPILDPLLEQFRSGVIIGSLHWRTRLPALARKLVQGVDHLTTTPWGATGPFALTWFVPRFGLSDEALPPEVFYPVRWQDARWILDPKQRVEDKVTKQTVAIHVWNECIRDYKHKEAPEGSFLRRLQDEGRP
jgi:hypothetical protein